MKKLLLFSIFLTAHTWGKSPYNMDIKIFSDRYYSGANLVYDCEAGHWVCTDDFGVATCLERRQRAYENFEFNLKCMNYKKFGSRSECYDRNRLLVTYPVAERYCFNNGYDEEI